MSINFVCHGREFVITVIVITEFDCKYFLRKYFHIGVERA